MGNLINEYTAYLFLDYMLIMNYREFQILTSYIKRNVEINAN